MHVRRLSGFVPNRNVAYRVDKANLGQNVKVTGEIRASTIDSLTVRLSRSAP
jgi:hypothetical protein